MIHPKHLFHPTLLAALLCALPLAGLHAQGNGGNHQGPPHGPPPNLLFDALDANHDGVIDANEIANAPAALKTLMKSGETTLTRDDIHPPHPPRDRDAQDAQDAHRHDPSSSDTTAAADNPRADEGRHGPPPHPADDQARPSADDAHDGPRTADHPADAHRHHAPPSVLFDALDTNHDGVISADEMASAPESLKKLDHSGTGQIKREDLRPPLPPQDNR